MPGLTLQMRFQNLRLFVSRANLAFGEVDAAKDTAAFIDELEKAISEGPPLVSPTPIEKGKKNGKSLEIPADGK